MADTGSAPQQTGRLANAGPFMRADALANHEQILDAAMTLAADRRVSMAAIAAAAGVGRSTLYRHFRTREDLNRALAQTEAHAERSPQADSPSLATVATMPFQSPGQLGRQQPIALEVTRVLDEVPPYLVAEQLVAEARRVAGVAVALYVVDIDGSHLLRLAGSPEFPEHVQSPPALGPELVPEELPAFYAQLQAQLPGCVAEPLWLRGRVTGLLLSLGSPTGALSEIATQGAATLELANRYTDVIEAARRHKPTSPAAEIQQNLLPPRIARIAGAQLAGILLPSYDVGGDWFDFVENRDGAWLAIADAAGKGPTAAGLGATALGALRAARRDGSDLEHALTLMHETIRKLQNDDFYLTAIVARWHAPTAKLTWVNCGHLPPYLADADGNLNKLDSPHHPALGTTKKRPTFTTTERKLNPGERLILLTDGITERRLQDGGTFGVDGLKRALQSAANPTAASTVIAIQQAITHCWKEPLQDDGTVLVMTVA